MSAFATAGGRAFGTLGTRLALAIAASLALHAGAIYLLRPSEAGVAPPVHKLEVLLISSRDTPAEEPTPVHPPQTAPVPRTAPPPRRVETRREMAAHRDLAAPGGDPAPAALPEAPRPAEPPPSVATRVPEPPQQVTLAPPVDLVAGYGSSLSRLLARHREYPPLAAMRGWEGAVTMRLRVAPGGKLIEAKVESSSGHDVLDAKALDMVKRLGELPPPPEALREREFAVLVPVVFRLER